MPTPKKKAVKKTYKVKGNARQKLAIKKVVESGGRKPIGTAMKEAGYPATTAKNPKKLTESRAWQELVDEKLSDDFVIKQFERLFKAKRIDYFSFSKDMSDEEIKAHVEEAGLKVITIRWSDKGKLAFYAAEDNQVASKALDMLNKVKGRYSEKLELGGNIKTVVINKAK